jgi:hypothetical protein
MHYFFQKVGWGTFGAIFSQIHQVTLFFSEICLNRAATCDTKLDKVKH